MKFINTSLLIFGLILTFVSCLKVPTPSPTVLIVNHLNYLRYDYPANPTSLRPNGYPFYETTAHLNAGHRPFEPNPHHYSLNRTANGLNGLINLDELDDQLNGRLDQQLSNELNDRLSNHLSNHPNSQQNDPQIRHHIGQLNSQVDSQISRPDHQVNGDQVSIVSQPNRDSQPNGHSQSNSIESSQSNDLNNNRIDSPSGYPNEAIDRQLNQLTIDDQGDDLILTNRSEHQARLLELDLLQQSEPSLSLTLDADSPFLNQVQVSAFVSISTDHITLVLLLDY